MEVLFGIAPTRFNHFWVQCPEACLVVTFLVPRLRKLFVFWNFNYLADLSRGRLMEGLQCSGIKNGIHLGKRMPFEASRYFQGEHVSGFWETLTVFKIFSSVPFDRSRLVPLCFGPSQCSERYRWLLLYSRLQGQASGLRNTVNFLLYVT